MGQDRPKALVELAGLPIVAHALRHVLTCRDVSEVVVVAPVGHTADVHALAARVPAGDVSVRVVPGGPVRTDSVVGGIAALSDRVDLVLVHDAARALTPATVFERVVRLLRAGYPAVIPVLPVTDTVKQVGSARPDGLADVVRTVDRSSLRAVQTPQGFTREVLTRAHRCVAGAVTDDAGLVELAGGTVTTVVGDVRAMKITTVHDLEAAALWLDPAVRVPTLVVLGGPSGVGKTSIARVLARRLAAAHLRLDTVEQALRRAVGESATVGPEGYACAQALAGDLLVGGLDVVADAANRYVVMREAWLAAAESAGARCVQVALTCGDATEHRRRVQERVADIPEHRLPDWESVSAARWTPWPEADLHLDTASMPVVDAAAAIEAAVTAGAVAESARTEDGQG